MYNQKCSDAGNDAGSSKYKLGWYSEYSNQWVILGDFSGKGALEEAAESARFLLRNYMPDDKFGIFGENDNEPFLTITSRGEEKARDEP